MKRSLLALMALLAVFSSCFAEVLFGINYAATLKEVKALYPQAQYIKQKPAWLTENESFIKVTGSGIGADIWIAFEDLRPSAKQLLTKLESTESNQFSADSYKATIFKSEDEALTVDWVRIVYNGSIPVDVFNKRYGKPAKCSHDEKFSLICKWPDKALQATLSSDEKFVRSAETEFTKAEKQIWFLKAGKSIPPWLN